MTTRKKLPKGFRKWADVEKELFTPEEIAEMRGEVESELLVEMSLAELRKKVGLTQAEVARAAEMTQPEISAIEKREDHKISTLRRMVHALGGTLEIVANVKGQRVRLLES